MGAEEMRAERRAISEEELAKHSSEKDCWICVHDLVLNCSEEFLSEHPGGPDVITCLAGKDITNDFEDIAHSDSAREWTNKLIIGYKEGADEEAKTKLMPKISQMRGGSGGGGGLGALPAVVVVILAAVAFYIFRSG